MLFRSESQVNTLIFTHPFDAIIAWMAEDEQSKVILSTSRNAPRGRHCEMTYTV